MDNNEDVTAELNSFFQSAFAKKDDKSLIWFNDFMHCVHGDNVRELFDFDGQFAQNLVLNY